MELSEKEKANMTRGEYLRLLRHFEGLTIRQVTAVVKMSPSYLCALEQGKYKISFDKAYALIKAYGGDLDIFASLPLKKA